MRTFISLLLICFVRIAFAGSPVPIVIYPGDEFRFAEYLETLRTALDKTIASHGPYVLKPASVSMNEDRYLAEARSGKLVNVVWSAATRDNERNLLPVRIPLGKGILGYRIALIHKDNQHMLGQIKSLDDLRKYSFGLGRGWGDVPIYQKAGIPIVTANYESLFKMLASKRFHIFSRGINEVFLEYDEFNAELPAIAIEQNLLLHYPYPFYFFVSPSEPLLAARIEKGLRFMLKDGSFDRIFEKYNGHAIKLARLAQRQIIEIPNPELPEATPLNDPELWFRPNSRPLAGTDLH